MSDSTCVGNTKPLFSSGRRNITSLLVLAILVALSPQSVAQFRTAKRETPMAKSTNVSSGLSYDSINRSTGFIPASEKEVMQVVRGIETANSDKDEVALCGWFDNSNYLNRILAGTRLPASIRVEFEAGLEQNGPFQQIATQILRMGGHYQFLRLQRRNGEIRPVFRSIVGDTGVVNYQELVVNKGTGQGPRVVDFYSSVAGDYIALTVRSTTLAEIIAGSPPGSVPTSGIDPEVVASAELMKTIGINLANGRYRECLSGMEQLPVGVRHEKAFLGLKSIIAKRVGLDEFQISIEELVRHNPDRIACDLALLELYRHKSDDNRTIEIVDRLIPAVQDPYLNFFKIQPLVRQNRLSEAKEAIAAAKTAAPGRSEIFVSEIGLLMKLKNHAATAEAIDDVEQQFGDHVLTLTSFPEFNEFSESEPGMACLARRAGF